MRKLLAILQIFVLMAAMALPTAFAAEAPIMLAGLETASSSSSTEAQHDWDTNLFFQTMQEKTGIAFSFTEYVSREAWTEGKTEMLAGEVAMPDMFFKAELTPQETLAFYEAGKLIDLRPYLRSTRRTSGRCWKPIRNGWKPFRCPMARLSPCRASTN